ncbi:MAG: hypothetical protein C4326_09680 [Ignavibacteria bacterium]
MKWMIIFKNDANELRAGWQIGVFILILATTSLLFIAPLVAVFNVRNQVALSTGLLVAALVATWMVTRWVNRKPFVAVGLSVNAHTMKQLGIGCLLGWLMMTVIFGFQYVSDHVMVTAPDISLVDGVQAFVGAALFFAVAAMSEEVLFRGYPFQTLVRGIGFIPSAVVMGVLFAAAHLMNPNASVFGFVNTFLVALLFSLAYWRTRSLWLPFGIHFAWNFSQTTLYGYPTSGVHFMEYELTRLTQFGPEWTTGGAYGPEGGALATVTILVCGWYVYASGSLRPHPGAMTLERETETIRWQMAER